MSASPADVTPGRTPGRTPNGGPAPVIRRPRNDDPLVRPKDRNKRRIARPPPADGRNNLQINGAKLPTTSHPVPAIQPPRAPTPKAPPRDSPIDDQNAVSGFSSKPLGEIHDYPIVLSKKALMDGFRHHVARFWSRRPVDPRNTEEFVRPVRLHRRDPKAPAAGAAAGKNGEQLPGAMDDMDDEQKKKEEILKAEREAAKEAEAALVAPAVSNTGQRRLGNNMKKTEQVFRNDQTEEQKARSKLRYEEALPWHLEDFDNKSIWVGSYEAALSYTYAMMAQGPDGAYRLMPLEKWYKFTQKNQFKALTAEEAEASFNKKVKEPRWFMDSEESKRRKQVEQESKKANSGLFIGKWERGAKPGASAAPVTKNEAADADDLDFIEDRFADDEENMLFEEDDETKEAEERIKRDQLQANVFDLKEEKEYDKQEQLERKERDAEKKLGKHVKKALMKREKNYVYDSDSTDNPYTSESESDSTETERQKEAERVKTENKTTPEKGSLNLKQKPPGSGASSRGTNTPSGRPSKHPSPHPTGRSSSSNLKRPGSPLASDASGNESAARKKSKKKHLNAAGTSSQASAFQPPSRPGSPPVPSGSQSQTDRSANVIPSKRMRGTGHAGSGSDSEGAMGGAASGGEMSDGTRKRIRLKLNPSKQSTDGTPSNSRAHSPDASLGGDNNNNNNGTTGSRGLSQPTTRPSSPPFPTAADVRAHIPVTGIRMGELLAHFRGQIVGEDRKTRFTRLMRENSKFIKETRLLVPLDSQE